MPQAVFVLGCHRSGTTVVGSYVGSGGNVADLQEYFAFYHALVHAPEAYRYIPTRAKDAYLESLLRHAKTFALDFAASRGRDWAVDSTPWNTLVIEDLERLMPDAVCVLMIRGWAGVVQSLDLSWRSGYRFAGQDLADRLRLWAQMYEGALRSTRWPVIAVNYDLLCLRPGVVVEALTQALRGFGIGPDFDGRFAVGHALSQGQSPNTIATGSAEDFRWTGREPYHSAAWTAADEATAQQVCGPILDALRTRFPGAFSTEGVASPAVADVYRRSGAGNDLERELRQAAAASAAALAGPAAARRGLPAGDSSSPMHAFTDLLGEELAGRGYEIAVHGEAQWNGVAILSRVGLDDVVTGIPGGPGFPHPEARAVAATCGGIRVHSVYVPNGRTPDSDHYHYKLAWLAALRDLVAAGPAERDRAAAT